MLKREKEDQIYEKIKKHGFKVENGKYMTRIRKNDIVVMEINYDCNKIMIKTQEKEYNSLEIISIAYCLDRLIVYFFDLKKLPKRIAVVV